MHAEHTVQLSPTLLSDPSSSGIPCLCSCKVMPGHLLQESPRVMQSWLPSEVQALSCAQGASLAPGALPGKHVLAQSQGLTGRFTPL